MSVIRVGFFLGQVGWLGGVNYFRNLFSALQSLPDVKIQPVVFAGLNSDVAAFKGMSEIIRSPIFDRYTPPWFASKLLSRVFPRRDYILYRLMRKHDIELLSHSKGLWRKCPIPSIAWIPDFQHMHLPEFFEKKECTARDRIFREIIRDSDAVLLSSQDALNDLKKFSPSNSKPTYVLRFVSGLLPEVNASPGREDLIARYKLDRPWFHVPNQFWAHKNHLAIVEALRLLKAQGIFPLVITSGSTVDNRNPDYFKSVMTRVGEYGLQEDFRVLGVVPYSDVMGLMRHSVAVVNPSLFEGWSTSVEESKSMGKRIIISDIAVHREQNPERGYYFNVNDYMALAKQMESVLSKYSEPEDLLHQDKAKCEQIINKMRFANEYQNIVLDVIKNARKKK